MCITLWLDVDDDPPRHRLVKGHAVSYNFARIHKTLRITPAMAAGVSDHVWSLEEIIQMADNYLPESAKRGPYKKRVA